MSDLMNRLLKSVKTSPMAAVMTESKVFKEREIECPTGIHVLDIALSGRHGGGVQPGVTMLAAPSKHAKTYFALILVSAYLRKYPDAVCYFLDSELGAGMKYLEATGVDPARVIHVPVSNVENAKFELLSALNAIERGEHVIYLYDSLGNTASKKETDDATDGKAVADMSRAKAIKSFFRIVTPEVNMKNVPLVVVNHVYLEQTGLYAKTITSGGCLESGTQIKTPDGTKSIEDFVVGDVVVTMDGFKRVTHVWNPQTLENGTPECYTITFEDGSSVTCSDEHKFLIDGEWLEAKNLVIGQDVMVH